MVEMVGRYPEIVVVIAVRGRIVQGPETHIEIVYTDILRINGFGGRTQPGAVELQAVLEREARAVEALVGIRSLEAHPDGMVAVLIERFMVGGGEGKIVVVEDAAGGLVG